MTCVGVFGTVFCPKRRMLSQAEWRNQEYGDRLRFLQPKKSESVPPYFPIPLTAPVITTHNLSLNARAARIALRKKRRGYAVHARIHRIGTGIGAGACGVPATCITNSGGNAENAEC